MNVWRNGHAGPTMVLLGGLGTAAPALDFAPLIEQLGAYDVIVVEGFGYGYSDPSARRPRTVQNITAELHDVLSRLDAPKPYILVGHSIAGFYHPRLRAAVSGRGLRGRRHRPDRAGVGAGLGGTSGMSLGAVGTVLRTSGLVRAAFTLAPGLAEPAGGAFTDEERARIRAMSIWNFGNAAVADETARMGGNASALRGVDYAGRPARPRVPLLRQRGDSAGLGGAARGPAAQRPAA